MRHTKQPDKKILTPEEASTLLTITGELTKKLWTSEYRERDLGKIYENLIILQDNLSKIRSKDKEPWGLYTTVLNYIRGPVQHEILELPQKLKLAASSQNRTQDNPYDKALIEKIFKAGEADKGVKLFPKRSDRLYYLFEDMIINLRFPEIVQMYTYFRDTPSEAQNFRKLRKLITDKTLDELFTDKTLDELWINVLQRKDNYKAFSGIPDFKRHRLQGQSEDTPDLRHPFDIMAGHYYYNRTSKRNPLFCSAKVSSENIDQKHFNKALENFEIGCKKFRPVDKADAACVEAIQTQIDLLKKLGNLDDVENFPWVQAAYQIIREQIAMVRSAQDKDLEAGIKYGDFNCYYRAQVRDLQYITDTGILNPEIIELIRRAEKRAEVATQQHFTTGHLLKAHTYFWIAKAYQEAKTLIPPSVLFTVPQTCGYEKRFPQSYEQLFIHKAFLENEKTYFKEALSSLQTAEAVEGKYSDITYNATRGKPISKTALLKFDGEKCKTIGEFRRLLTKIIIDQCPDIKISIRPEVDAISPEEPKPPSLS